MNAPRTLSTPSSVRSPVATSPVEGNLTVVVHEKSYAEGHTILKDVAFSVAATEFVSLLGPSGSGKTTTLRLIAGLDREFDGSISVGDSLVLGPGPDRGVVFQESRLLPWMTVEQNVAFALPEGLPRDVRASRVSDILEKVGLKAVAKVWPFQLSGGMEKRVALARALVNLPAILLMDEPFSALDPLNRFGLQDEVARIHAKEKLTTLLVTHDIDEAVYLSDRILVISGEPAAICAEFLVNNPRPRTRGSREMLSLQAEVFALMLAANTAPVVGSTTWTPTPKDNVKQQ